MDTPRPADSPASLDVEGPLSRDQARLLLDRGAELLSSGDFGDAFRHYRRVIGFDDPEITATALLGAGQSRYRMDDEAGAVASWEAILELPETAATYLAWRELAAARVRDGDLQGAIAAYRAADKRAPQADKPEIANRLGWLAKETGNVRASRRYFARGRGSVIPLVTYGIIGITAAVSLTALFSTDSDLIYNALWLDKDKLDAGQLWRLLSVTLLHGSIIHFAFNMYALYICGPIVEQIYGPIRTLIFYLVAAAGGSVATFALSEGNPVVGASGAIFGFFGLLFTASRLHLPMLDRRGRALISQVGMLIVVNILIGFALPGIDNIAHLGGLATGVLLGIAVSPIGVPTMRGMWQPGNDRAVAARFIGSPIAAVVAIGLIAVLLVAGMLLGFARWPLS